MLILRQCNESVHIHVLLYLFYILEFSKIVIVGGRGRDTSGHLDWTELVDLKGDCTTTLPRYPMKLKYATGIYISGAIVICGGTDYYDVSTNKCYKLQKGRTSFELLTTMQESRFAAKSIVVQHHMWVTGGKNSITGSILSSTEFITTMKFSETYPNETLPENVAEHALIRINETTSYLIGGQHHMDMIPSKKTHFYNHYTKVWTTGPELLTERRGHTAGTIIDHDTLAQHIVVVAGTRSKNENEEILDSVEFLYNGENMWKTGKFDH